MASAESITPRTHDHHVRRRPFTSWMRRLANLKYSHGNSNQSTTSRPVNISANTKGKNRVKPKNSPYPLPGRIDSGRLSFSTPLSSQRSRHSSMSHSKHSMSISHESQLHQKSRAPTLATTAETIVSDTGRSGAGTSATVARTDGDRDSTFSSPAPSLRSITTTLTTMRSAAPGIIPHNNPLQNTHSLPATQPASAVPAHLAPHSHPTTYHSATANNVLSDDASILTLASSSKRRRRNSVDTNASMKALAPTSLFGGSRESLPLSILSGIIIHPGQGGNAGDTASLRDAPHYPRSASAFNNERASLVSASGVTAPALASERNSYISSKPTGDGGSVRSGLLGHGFSGDRDRVSERPYPHGRNDSVGASSITNKDRLRELDSERDMLREKALPLAPTGS